MTNGTRQAGSQVARQDVPFLSSTDEIIEDMRNGRMVVLVDAEDRENEGDLVVPAQMATPDVINFMAKHGRGLICLTMTAARAHELRLEAMTRSNNSRNRTAFTVSIEAREGISTGISAHDRARTIACAIDPTKGATDIVSPGHVFPLVAREGGVLIRSGHTEASVDLARLAGLYPAAVICEIMNDDGTMARVPDLIPFAQKHGLKIGTIDDLIAYRLRNDRIVKRVAEAKVTSAHGGPFDLYVYEPTVEPGEHLALVKGDIRSGGPVLVRVHAVNALADLLGVSEASPSGTPIAQSMQAIAEEGRGGPTHSRNGSGGGEQRARIAAATRSAVRSKSASARRSCATSGSPTWCFSPIRRRMSIQASRRSGSGSSARGGSDSPW